MKKSRMKKMMIFPLVLALCLNILPMDFSVHAETLADAQTSICEHHAEHTEECGYQSAMQEVSCGHVHMADCYASAAVLANDSVSGNDIVSGNDGGVCLHIHDEECGYVAQAEEIPCGYECLLCNPIEITEWTWIDEWEMIDTETNVLPLIGVSEANPVDKETLTEFLPTAIYAEIGGSEQEITLGQWDCPEFPQGTVTGGNYTFTASLPEGYVLSEDADKLEVTFELGGVMLYSTCDVENGVHGTLSTDGYYQCSDCGGYVRVKLQIEGDSNTYYFANGSTLGDINYAANMANSQANQDKNVTITLLRDCNSNYQISFSGNRTVTLDLNGKKLDLTDDYAELEFAGTVNAVITDSSDGAEGNIEKTYYKTNMFSAYPIHFVSTGTLTLEKGSILAEDRALYVESGTVTMKDGFTIESEGGSNAYYDTAVSIINDAVFVMEGGTIIGAATASEGALYVSSTNVELKGGTIKSGGYAVYIYNNKYMKLTGEMDLQGAKADFFIEGNAIGKNEIQTSLTGTPKGDAYTVYSDASDATILELGIGAIFSGGSFNKAFFRSAINGYQLTENANGELAFTAGCAHTGGVVAGTNQCKGCSMETEATVQKSGDSVIQCYATWEEAIEAIEADTTAYADCTLTLTDNIAEYITLTNGTYDFNLNGYTLTGQVILNNSNSSTKEITIYGGTIKNEGGPAIRLSGGTLILPKVNTSTGTNALVLDSATYGVEVQSTGTLKLNGGHNIHGQGGDFYLQSGATFYVESTPTHYNAGETYTVDSADVTIDGTAYQIGTLADSIKNGFTVSTYFTSARPDYRVYSSGASLMIKFCDHVNMSADGMKCQDCGVEVMFATEINGVTANHTSFEKAQEYLITYGTNSYDDKLKLIRDLEYVSSDYFININAVKDGGSGNYSKIKFTFDLNGHTLKNGDYRVVVGARERKGVINVINGDVTFTDSQGGGAVVNTYTAYNTYPAIHVLGYDTTTAHGDIQPSVIFDGGSYKSTGGYAVLISGENAKGRNLQVTINDGDFEGKYTALYLEGYTGTSASTLSLNVTGGKFTCAEAATASNTGVIHLTGGTNTLGGTAVIENAGDTAGYSNKGPALCASGNSVTTLQDSITINAERKLLLGIGIYENAQVKLEGDNVKVYAGTGTSSIGINLDSAVAKLTMSKGSVISGGYGIRIDTKGGTVDITGGSVEGYYGITMSISGSNSGTLNVSGTPTIKGSKNSYGILIKNNDATSIYTVNISGGTIGGADNASGLWVNASTACNEASRITISGGTFVAGEETPNDSTIASGIYSQGNGNIVLTGQPTIADTAEASFRFNSVTDVAPMTIATEITKAYTVAMNPVGIFAKGDTASLDLSTIKDKFSPASVINASGTCTVTCNDSNPDTLELICSHMIEPIQGSNGYPDICSSCGGQLSADVLDADGKVVARYADGHFEEAVNRVQEITDGTLLLRGTQYVNMVITKGKFTLDLAEFNLSTNLDTRANPTITIKGGEVTLKGDGGVVGAYKTKTADTMAPIVLVEDGILRTDEGCYIEGSQEDDETAVLKVTGGTVYLEKGTLSLANNSYNDRRVLVDVYGPTAKVYLNAADVVFSYSDFIYAKVIRLQDGANPIIITKAKTTGTVHFCVEDLSTFATPLDDTVDLSTSLSANVFREDNCHLTGDFEVRMADDGKSLALRGNLTTAIDTSTSITYSKGVAQGPAITVQYDSNDLVKGTDYTVLYESTDNGGYSAATAPTDAGSYKVTVTGIGNYYGTKNAEFTIDKADAAITIESGKESYEVTYGDASFALTGIADSNTDVAGVIAYEVTDGTDVVSVTDAGEVTILRDGEATITLTVSETDNYNAATSKTITVMVDRAKVTVPNLTRKYLYSKETTDTIDVAALLEQILPNAGTVTYMTMKVFPDGNEITFSTEPTITTEGKLSYTVSEGDVGDTISLVVWANSEKNYQNIEFTVSLELTDKHSVELKEGSAVTLESNALTYGKALSTLVFNDAVFVDEKGNEVPGTLAWEEGTVKPDITQSSANWKFTPKNADYMTVTGAVAITVNPATPEVTVAPTVSSRAYHPSVALADSDLTGGIVKGVDGTEMTGTWNWKKSDVVPTVGNSSYEAVFTPGDGSRYTSVTVNVNVAVTKATPLVQTVPAASAITYGDSLELSTLTGGTAVYSNTDATTVAGSFTWKDDSVMPTAADSNSTTYTVIFEPSDEDNYNSVEAKVTLTVNKAQNAPNMPNSTMDVTNSTEKVSDVTLPDGWAWQETDGSKELAAGVATNATAVYVANDKDNYENVTVEVSITRANYEHKDTSGASVSFAIDWEKVNAEVIAQAAAVKANPTPGIANVNVVSGGNIIVPAFVMESLKGQNVSLMLHNGQGVAMSISGAYMTGLVAQAVDVTVASNANTIPAGVVASKAANALTTQQMSVKNVGAMPVAVNMHVNVGSAFEGKYASLYRYNAVSGQLELAGCFLVTTGGQAMFGIGQGGEYLLVVTEEKPAGTVASTVNHYIVKSGDNMYAIARMYNMTFRNLRMKNPQVKDPNRIYVGDSINLY